MNLFLQKNSVASIRSTQNPIQNTPFTAVSMRLALDIPNLPSDSWKLDFLEPALDQNDNDEKRI